MRSVLSASIMCADPLAMGAGLDQLVQLGVEHLHLDIMDGHFVPNLMISTEIAKAVAARYKTPLDIHMMVDGPERMIAWFPMREGDFVSVHFESTPHVHRALSMIRQRGARPALALNPGTPLECAREVLPDIDMLLLMTVNPGYAAQALVPGALSKIQRARAMLDALGYPDLPIEVDGNCSFENVPKLEAAGASVFVVGSSSIFDPALGIERGVRNLRDGFANTGKGGRPA